MLHNNKCELTTGTTSKKWMEQWQCWAKEATLKETIKFNNIDISNTDKNMSG